MMASMVHSRDAGRWHLKSAVTAAGFSYLRVPLRTRPVLLGRIWMLTGPLRAGPPRGLHELWGLP